MNDLVLQARALSKSHRRGNEQIDVLRGLDLEIRAGEFVALMGPSGSGKTTLLNLVAGLDDPSAGELSVLGRRLQGMSDGARSRWRGRYVGIVFQSYNLLPALRAEQNVEIPLLLSALSRGERKRHVDTALELVSVAHRRRHYPRQLSGGEEQRVAIARAIVNDPKLLLCDEPTGDLDRRTSRDVIDLLSVLNRNHGKTIVVATHDPHVAAAAQRVLHLEDGALTTSTPP